MKIAFLTPGWPNGQNGIISYVRYIGPALDELGHEVIILSHDAHGRIGYEHVVQIPESPPGSLITRLIRKFAPGIGGPFDPWNAEAIAIAGCLAALEKGVGVDVVEMEETFGLCGLVADRANVPVVVRLHGPHFLNGVYENAGAGKLDQAQIAKEHRGILRASAITAPSRQVLEATRNYYHLTRDAAVIPNPIPVSETGPCWSIDTCDRNTILFVGRTDNRKGGDLVIRVFERLLKSRPSLRLHFVGPDAGFVDADPGMSMPQYLASRFAPGLREHVTYHGPLRPAEIAALRLKAHVTVVFSRYENFPAVCTEPLASGCPLVAARVGGIPEIVIDGVTGLLAETEDVDDMASKVAQLLDDDDLCIRLGAAGRALCRDEFSPQNIASRTLEIYREAIERHKRK